MDEPDFAGIDPIDDLEDAADELLDKAEDAATASEQALQQTLTAVLYQLRAIRIAISEGTRDLRS